MLKLGQGLENVSRPKFNLKIPGTKNSFNFIFTKCLLVANKITPFDVKTLD